MLFELRPLVLETQGLSPPKPSLRAEQAAGQHWPPGVELELPESMERLAPAVEQTMFGGPSRRRSAHKHARATWVQWPWPSRG